MKTLKICAVAALVTTLVMLSCAITCCASAEGVKCYPNRAEFYPRAAVIVALDYDTDEVTCVDYHGNEWRFYGCFDWCEGDLISLYIWNCGTIKDKTDDMVLDVEYDGWMDPNMMEMWLNH